jgi:hypothetical protein
VALSLLDRKASSYRQKILNADNIVEVARLQGALRLYQNFLDDLKSFAKEAKEEEESLE